MALYFITYDLRKAKNYQELYGELTKFNAVRILESTWCFNRINTSAKNLRAHFQQYIDNDDGLIISDVTDWASYNTKGTPNDLK